MDDPRERDALVLRLDRQCLACAIKSLRVIPNRQASGSRQEGCGGISMYARTARKMVGEELLNN